jgi:two-component system response regulator DesR
MLTAFGRPGYLRRAMEAGASGFVVKDAPAEQLAEAVRRVARGERSSIRRWPPRRWPAARRR